MSRHYRTQASVAPEVRVPITRPRPMLLLAFVTATALALGLAACKSEQPAQTPATPAEKPAAQQAPAAAPASVSGKINQEITITPDGDNLYWAQKELSVKAGTTVKLTFKNTASAANGMAHNWVLTKPGTDQQVATDSMQAGEDHNWVAEGPNVIAHTPLVKPGSEASVTFTAPPAGEYTYICAYPGHATTMNGKLISK